MKSLDKVILRRVRAAANVGVSEAERAAGQDVLFDVELHLDLGPAALNDDLNRAPDYAAVADLLRETAAKRPYRLLETMAQAAADSLLRRFAVERVVLRVRKAGLRIGARRLYAAIEITRPRHA